MELVMMGLSSDLPVDLLARAPALRADKFLVIHELGRCDFEHAQ